MTTHPPKVTLNRLQNREKHHRRETAKMTYKGRPLKSEPVSVLGLWLLQGGKCGCGCGRPLDPLARHPALNSIVIAHRLLRSKGGGHTIKNVELWWKECNDREAAEENKARGTGNHTSFSEIRKAKPKASLNSQWNKRCFTTNRDGAFKQKMNGKVVRR